MSSKIINLESDHSDQLEGLSSRDKIGTMLNLRNTSTKKTGYHVFELHDRLVVEFRSP